MRYWSGLTILAREYIRSGNPSLCTPGRQGCVTQDLDFSTLLALGGFDRPSLIILRLSEGDPDTVSRRSSAVETPTCLRPKG